MARPDLQFIDLVDFTPGISNRYGNALGHRPSSQGPDGMAQLDGTWGCYGDPKGGLRPLPARQNVLTKTNDDIQGGLLDYPDTEQYVPILDMAIVSPVMDESYKPDTANPEAAFFNFYYYAGSAPSTWSTYSRIRQYKLYKSGVPTTDLYSASEASAASTEYLAYGGFSTGRASKNGFAEGLAGTPVIRAMISNMKGNIAGSNLHKAVQYPDADDTSGSPGLDGQGDLLTNKEMAFIFGHQGRVVYGVRVPPTGALSQPFEYFGLHGRLPAIEQLVWSDVNAGPPNIQPEFASVFVEENPSGYGAFASMNASELFMVKHRGGAVVLRGSLENPTVVRLPGVEPTRGMMHYPVVTPLGCIYGSRSGVWVWNGSDTSECVSPNLDGCFWETGPYTGLTRPGLKGRFGYSYPFVFAPNDWIMDTRTGGWFKLLERSNSENPYMFYDNAYDGRMYAAPGALDNNTSALLDMYDMDGTLASHYQWKSQPIGATMNTDIQFRKIVLVAQGTGTVTVALEGLSGTPVTEVFNIASESKPVRYEINTACRATDLTVTIASDATVEGQTAPLVHAMHLGYNAKTGIPSGEQA